LHCTFSTPTSLLALPSPFVLIVLPCPHPCCLFSAQHISWSFSHPCPTLRQAALTCPMPKLERFRSAPLSLVRPSECPALFPAACFAVLCVICPAFLFGNVLRFALPSPFQFM
jgi:hypothetical protein